MPCGCSKKKRKDKDAGGGGESSIKLAGWPTGWLTSIHEIVIRIPFGANRILVHVIHDTGISIMICNQFEINLNLSFRDGLSQYFWFMLAHSQDCRAWSYCIFHELPVSLG